MKKNKIHFVGIGGIGMSAIARILNQKGFKVTGSDKKANTLMEEMRAEGVKCHIGHSAKNISDCDLVVYSSSIGKDNTELRTAQKKGIEVIHRATMLSRMIKDKKSIAVTGAHGKTTTTAILTLIFEKAGLKPTAAIGGEVLNFQSNAVNEEGDYFIFEADESDGSFLEFAADKIVLLNIDREHLDYFGNIGNAVKIYRQFVKNIKEGGTVFYNAEDKHLNRALRTYRGRRVSFATTGNPNVKADRIRQQGLTTYFRCIIDGKVMPGEVSFSAPGRHNVVNALAAIGVANEAGVGFNKIKEALNCYKGTKRRFEVRDIAGGVMLIEDYAHHPTEIKAVLEACKPLKKNLIVVFQPHRYTRTKDLFGEFISCFKPAARVILTDIYSASEKSIKGITAKRLFAEMKRSGIKNVEYMKKDAVAKRVQHIAGKGDVVLILGAGDINDVTTELSHGAL